MAGVTCEILGTRARLRIEFDTEVRVVSGILCGDPEDIKNYEEVVSRFRTRCDKCRLRQWRRNVKCYAPTSQDDTPDKIAWVLGASGRSELEKALGKASCL